MGKSDVTSEPQSVCGRDGETELRQAEPSKSRRGNENMLSEQIPYEGMTEQDWINYSKDMMKC